MEARTYYTGWLVGIIAALFVNMLAIVATGCRCGSSCSSPAAPAPPPPAEVYPAVK